MKPFAEEESSESVGGLTVENGLSRVAIYGQLDVTRDKAGLKRAKKLKALVDAIVEELEADESLPAKAADDTEPPVEVKNPFD